MGARVSQRGSHDTPDCGGYGNRQPKTTEQKGPVRGENPHADHHAEASDKQRLDLRSIDHVFNDAGAGYRGLQTGVDCFLVPFARADSRDFPASSGVRGTGLERAAAPVLLGRDTATVKPKDRHYRFPGHSSRATFNKPDLPMSFRNAVEDKERQPLVV